MNNRNWISLNLAVNAAAVFVAVVVISCRLPCIAAADDGQPLKATAKTGIKQRVPWTTSRVKGTPDPPPPYRMEVAFPGVKFEQPLDLVSEPASDRLFVVERYGKIFSFPNDRAAKDAKLFADLKKTTYSLAFHPQFPKTPYVYVVYILDPMQEEKEGTRLVRFSVQPDDPLTIDPKSETILLTWPSGGHNGGCLKFGPDGYLYVVTGDASGIADGLVTGQDLSDLPASILRIDVDHPDKGRNYGVPKDNPFVDTSGARPEIWAYGLRQAWRMSFDRATGDLWAGEVGQDLWEMIYLIEKGGNYGWSVMEGSHPFRPQRKLGPTPLVKPVIEHPHSDFRSITGGFVYHGQRLKDLQGAYVYGDYDTGRLWAMWYDRERKMVTKNVELVDTPLRIISFGQDNSGEVFVLDFIGGQVHRLVKREASTTTSSFPRKLSETGLFASTKDHQPAAGLIPYSVNSELWSDGAIKERFLALPGQSQIEFETVTYPQPAPGSTPGWRFPDGTVIVKTFSLETEPGNPASRRRLETRLLHYEQLGGNEEVGDQYWLGYTYIWNDDQTDAVLAEAKGEDRVYKIKDAAAEGGFREQKWHYPSRAECTLCHTMAAKYVLGVNTEQMNRLHDYGEEVVANQLDTLNHVSAFKQPLPQPAAELRKLAEYSDASQSLEVRARAYLHANCSHCHRKWGGGNGEFQLLATLPLDELGVVGVKPAHGAFEIAQPALLAPGHPERSLIFARMTKLGLGRMPHVASNVVDAEAVELIKQWIAALPVASK